MAQPVYDLNLKKTFMRQLGFSVKCIGDVKNVDKTVFLDMAAMLMRSNNSISV